MSKKETVAVATESNEVVSVSTKEQPKDNNFDSDSQDFGDMPVSVFEGKQPVSGYESILEDITHEMEKAENTTNVGILELKKANQWTKEAAEQPDPMPLFHELWYEGEVCCLFADTNLGKSVLAVQIADEIARAQPTRKVLYLDCELSDRQFAMRYKDKESGTRYIFPDNLIRAQIQRYCGSDSNSFEDNLLKSVEDGAMMSGADVIIIDNLTYLCNQAEKGEAAGRIMQRLTDLKLTHGWSLLVIAHTPKRDLSRAITQNDLAGSKKIINFLDSAFAIGRSATGGPGKRYIKQIKTRAGEELYGSNNVIVCSLGKSAGFLHFEKDGYDKESNHLVFMGINEKKDRDAEVIRLHQDGMSFRKISECKNISKSAVERIINEWESSNSAEVSQAQDSGTDGTDGTDGTGGTPWDSLGQLGQFGTVIPTDNKSDDGGLLS